MDAEPAAQPPAQPPREPVRMLGTTHPLQLWLRILCLAGVGLLGIFLAGGFKDLQSPFLDNCDTCVVNGLFFWKAYDIRITNDLAIGIEVRERCIDTLGEPEASRKLRGLDAFCAWYTESLDYNGNANTASPGKSVVSSGVHNSRDFVLLDYSNHVLGCGTVGRATHTTTLRASQFSRCNADYRATP